MVNFEANFIDKKLDGSQSSGKNFYSSLIELRFIEFLGLGYLSGRVSLDPTLTSTKFI